MRQARPWRTVPAPTATVPPPFWMDIGTSLLGAPTLRAYMTNVINDTRGG
jgi:hypothetical protein